MRTFSLALAAGLVSATGFAPLHLWPLTLLTFAVLLHLLGRARTLPQALALGWAFGLGQFVLGLNWIATAFTYQAAMPAWLGWVAVVVLSIYLAIYPALAAGLAWRWGGGRPAPAALMLAAGWTVTEWLRGTIFTGFAWNPVGVAWIGTPVAQAAPWIGTYGLSALAVLAGGALLGPARRDRAATALGLLPLAAALPALWAAPAPPGRIPVHVVQPNIDQDTRNAPDYAYVGLLKLARLSQPPRDGRPPRLVLWPEGAVEYYPEDDPAAREAIASLLRHGDLMLTGSTRIERRGDEPVGARNSVYLLDPAARLRWRYDKAHLVPYGEYLPMRPLLSAAGLSRLVPGDLDFRPGPGPRSFALPGFGRVGVQLCYEIIFSGEVVDAGDRPDFLFNPSNDAWFGAWGPPQHLAQARLRAIEEGLPVVRATPNGVSAIVDPAGRVTALVPRRRAGVMDATIPAALPPTPFARAGNALPFGLALLLGGGAIALARRRR